ncbi:hypothetical protein BJV77DRAFT_138343 [Russula vinacea]|nr:hypothetical protein BJV77DRAFT_138343 [Russula vinacea]
MYFCLTLLPTASVVATYRCSHKYSSTVQYPSATQFRIRPFQGSRTPQNRRHMERASTTLESSGFFLRKVRTACRFRLILMDARGFSKDHRASRAASVVVAQGPRLPG